jgi:hypothetical protein
MKLPFVTAALVLLVGLAQAVLAALPAKDRWKELCALEQKMVGVWKGQGGCAGNFLFRAGGTYELTEYGPGHYNCTGTWKIRWDALPATLVLTCKTSNLAEVVGKTTEVKLIRLDDDALAIEDASQTVDHYARQRK